MLLRAGDPMCELASLGVLGLMGHIMSLSASVDISQRLADVQAAIAHMSGAGANTREVTLVAVSKMQAEARIEAALAAGQRVFGENRVQEAQKRWGGRRTRFGDLELRLIGPLQTNKAEAAVELFDVIETLDRPKLARVLAKAIEKTGRRPDILIQINTGQERQKAGVHPAEFPDLLALARDLELPVCGLMCIPPIDEAAGPHFASLAALAARSGLETVSMGMSADYELAIRLGATHVRIGSAVFGERLARPDASAAQA